VPATFYTINEYNLIIIYKQLVRQSGSVQLTHLEHHVILSPTRELELYNCAPTMNGHREQGASLLLPPPPPSDRPSSPPPPPPEELGYPPPPPRQIPQPRKEALSIEEILRKKKNADEAAAKPKFLSKAQREKIALEKRHKEVEAQRQQVQIKRELQHNGTNGTSRVAAVPQKENPRPAAPAIPTGPRAMRQSKLANGSHDMPPPRVPLETTKPLQENGKALQKNAKPSQEDAAATLIRQRYMGADQNKSNFSAGKKRKRTTEKKLYVSVSFLIQL